MKHIFIIQLVIIFLFCSCNSELEITESISSRDVTENAIINEQKVNVETPVEIKKSKNEFVVDKIFNALIEKVEIYNLIHKGGVCHDPIQYNYYKGTKSKGEYTIADLYVEKMLSNSKIYHDNKGSYIEFSCNDIRADYDAKINKFTQMGKMVMTSKNGEDVLKYRIYIDNVTNPSKNDKNCIIAAYCGNSCYSSFAAEISIHADVLQSPMNLIAYKNAIMADMTCFKSSTSDFYINYKLSDGGYLNEQKQNGGQQYDV